MLIEDDWSAEHCSARTIKIYESCRAMLGAPFQIVSLLGDEPALNK